VEPADGAEAGGSEICEPRTGLGAGADAPQVTGFSRKGRASAGARLPAGEPRHAPKDKHVYAALDLGTNNCRLLIAKAPPPGAGQDGFRVIDSFSRIVRLGEGLSRTGELGAAAIERTLRALEICRDKMQARGVTRSRLIATEACRSARNSAEFLSLVRETTGLELEIVDRETEARLAATGSMRPIAPFYSTSAAALPSSCGSPAPVMVLLRQVTRGSTSAYFFGLP
jgi:exopolyphosphatase/guanosine-5'-triphosphate,3'-diphosphate pyrophosphatase